MLKTVSIALACSLVTGVTVATVMTPKSAPVVDTSSFDSQIKQLGRKVNELENKLTALSPSPEKITSSSAIHDPNAPAMVQLSDGTQLDLEKYIQDQVSKQTSTAESGRPIYTSTDLTDEQIKEIYKKTEQLERQKRVERHKDDFIDTVFEGVDLNQVQTDYVEKVYGEYFTNVMKLWSREGEYKDMNREQRDKAQDKLRDDFKLEVKSQLTDTQYTTFSKQYDEYVSRFTRRRRGSNDNNNDNNKNE